jgi:hypothetical protein
MYSLFNCVPSYACKPGRDSTTILLQPRHAGDVTAGHPICFHATREGPTGFLFPLIVTFTDGLDSHKPLHCRTRLPSTGTAVQIGLAMFHLELAIGAERLATECVDDAKVLQLRGHSILSSPLWHP